MERAAEGVVGVAGHFDDQEHGVGTAEAFPSLPSGYDWQGLLHRPDESVVKS